MGHCLLVKSVSVVLGRHETVFCDEVEGGLVVTTIAEGEFVGCEAGGKT